MKRIVLIVMLFVGLIGWAQKPYVVADFSERDLPRMLSVCNKSGIDYLVQRTPFSSYGHYDWNEDFATDGEATVRRMVQEAESQGVHIGIMAPSDAISTDDPYFQPKYYKHLRRVGPLALYDDLAADERDIALYRSDVLKTPSTLNMILIEDEMITYSTMEYAGELVLLHRCTRGAYGTKSVAHQVDADAFKIWDSPERYLAPDDYLRDIVHEQLNEKLKAVGINFVLYKGDSGQDWLEETVRVRQAERWETDGVPNGSIGWFMIRSSDKKRAGTTIEELEWMLSKAAAYHAGFGLVVDPKAMLDLGTLDEMLEMTKQWTELISLDAFSDGQREMMRDPYTDWHLVKSANDSYLLYPTGLSRRFRCNFVNDDEGVLTSETWEWKSDEEGVFGMQILVEGTTSISNPMVNTEKGLALFATTIAPGQRLIYTDGDNARLVDANYNTLEEIPLEGLAMLPEGKSEVYFICEADPEGDRPEVILRYVTHGEPEEIHPNK